MRDGVLMRCGYGDVDGWIDMKSEGVVSSE